MQQGVAALAAEGIARGSMVAVRKVELRGAGQAGILVLEDGPHLLQRFHAEHEKRFGYRREDQQVELVAISLTIDGPACSQWQKKRQRRYAAKSVAKHRTWFGHSAKTVECAWYERESLRPGAYLEGPAVVAEYSATTLVPPGWKARIDDWNCLVLERTS
jgi:N-methylhydantoinase A/oxoprolinase/acetone carboxylase beta subunit